MQILYRLTIAAYLLILPSLTGCALSPQTVAIIPVLDGIGTSVTPGKQLAIQVRDTRANSIIGYRGGVYDTAAITTAENLTTSIEREVTQAYSKSGYSVTEAGTADIRVMIDIESMDYKAQQNNIIWDIEFSAAIRVTATSGTGEKSLQLQDRLTKQYAKAPSPRENEALINDVITTLLRRLVENNEFLTI